MKSGAQKFRLRSCVDWISSTAAIIACEPQMRENPGHYFSRKLDLTTWTKNGVDGQRKPLIKPQYTFAERLSLVYTSPFWHGHGK